MKTEQTIKVTVNRMHKLEDSGSLKAYADITLNDTLMIKGVRIVESKNGLFMSMPQNKAKDDRWYDIVHPVTPEARESLQEQVISAYQEA